MNEGEAPQYYVDKQPSGYRQREVVFELAQFEMSRRRQHEKHTSATTVFSGRLICGECGAYFGSKVWHSTDAYRSVVYRCNRKYAQKGKPCPSPHVREEEIKAAFERALGRMLERRSEIFSAYETMIASLTDTARQERELERTQARLDEINLEMEHMVCRNAKTAPEPGRVQPGIRGAVSEVWRFKGKDSQVERTADCEGRQEAEIGSVH